ncbi:MAG: hypothetical protein JWN65_2716 [Solirubrobacterales bacterium]|nr:hypothetical protein [Solirubrobacterales bacterium]
MRLALPGSMASWLMTSESADAASQESRRGQGVLTRPGRGRRAETHTAAGTDGADGIEHLPVGRGQGMRPLAPADERVGVVHYVLVPRRARSNRRRYVDPAQVARGSPSLRCDRCLWHRRSFALACFFPSPRNDAA